jgi:hypothetical protein
MEIRDFDRINDLTAICELNPGTTFRWKGAVFVRVVNDSDHLDTRNARWGLNLATGRLTKFGDLCKVTVVPGYFQVTE